MPSSDPPTCPPETALNPYNYPANMKETAAGKATETGLTVSRAFSRPTLAFAFLLILGCQADEIARYRAPRTDEAAVRLIAAIFPQGEKSWVFKLQGPEAEVAQRTDTFTEFIRSVKFDPKAEPPVTWKLPADWRKDAERPDRFATLRLGPKDDALELTVSHLSGPMAGNVLANVNRWRPMIGLRPIAEAALVQVTKKLAVDGGEVVIVDMSGPGGSAKMPPMPPATGAKPPTVPPQPTGAAPFAFRKPDGWTEYRDPKGVAAVAFHAGEGDAVEITVTRLGGPAGGLVANVNRWRMQIGLPETSGEEVRRDARQINVGGSVAEYVDLLGPATGSARQRIVGIILSREDVTWFFKMRGPADRVEQQLAAFQAFVGSVRFDGKGGQ